MNLIHTATDGKDYTFAHLTVYDIYGDPKRDEVNGLLPLYRRSQKREIIDTMKMAGATTQDIITELAGVVAEPITSETFVKFLNSPTGRQQLIEYCWDKANKGTPLPTLDILDWKEVIDKLLAPFGISFGGKDEPVESVSDTPKPEDMSTYGDGGPDPNCKAPETYSQAGA